MRLEGKTAVVTGAASGIGLATAETMARAGAAVVLADVAVERGQAEAERLRSAGREAQFLPVDMTSDDSVAAFASTVLGRGEVHILVNGAGYGKGYDDLNRDVRFECLVDVVERELKLLGYR